LFFQGTKQVVIWWCQLRHVGWMWEHCPSKICDGISFGMIKMLFLWTSCEGGNSKLRPLY
jgi:hypothetical protein